MALLISTFQTFGGLQIFCAWSAASTSSSLGIDKFFFPKYGVLDHWFPFLETLQKPFRNLLKKPCLLLKRIFGLEITQDGFTMIILLKVI